MTDVPIPSYRMRPPEEGPPWRMLAVGGGIAGALLLGAGIMWGVGKVGGPRSVPLIEPDPRPFKVRPDDPGGLRVPNQDELIFERNRGGTGGQAGGGRLAPEPEAPRIDALRAQVAQPSAPSAPAPEAGAPAAVAPPQPAATAPVAAEPAPAARPAPAPNGSLRVQLGALPSEEAARGEWDRISRRHADLFGAFRPQVLRFERDGQATLYRLRTGGFADLAAARSFCEEVKSRGVPCMVVR